MDEPEMTDAELDDFLARADQDLLETLDRVVDTEDGLARLKRTVQEGDDAGRR